MKKRILVAAATLGFISAGYGYASLDTATAGDIIRATLKKLHLISDPLAPGADQVKGQPFIRPGVINEYLTEIGNSKDPIVNSPGSVNVPYNGESHQLHLPVRYWEVSGLGLYGLADFAKVDQVLGDEAATFKAPRRHPLKIDDTHAMIFIYSANLNGSDVGPVKDFFVSILLEPNSAETKFGSVANIYTWMFYQNSPLNLLWKTKFWGLVNELGRIDFSFAQNLRRSVLSLPDSQGQFTEALRMTWKIGNMPVKPIEMSYDELKIKETREVFVSQLGRVFVPFSFKGSLLIDSSPTDPAKGTQSAFPPGGMTRFDKSRDEFIVNNAKIKEKLNQIGFQPDHWIAITDYSGHLNFPRVDGDDPSKEPAVYQEASPTEMLNPIYK